MGGGEGGGRFILERRSETGIEVVKYFRRGRAAEREEEVDWEEGTSSTSEEESQQEKEARGRR
jgi:hypothetical protein